MRLFSLAGATCHRIDLLAAAIVRAGSVSTKGLENTLTSRYTLPVTRDSSKTRRRLIAAADGLFYGQGIRAVGVDAVAEAAGVTKRTLYCHFASKDDLIAAYLEERDLPTLGRYQGVIPEGGAPAARRIRRIFEQLGKNAEDPRWLMAQSGSAAGCK